MLDSEFTVGENARKGMLLTEKKRINSNFYRAKTSVNVRKLSIFCVSGGINSGIHAVVRKLTED